MGSRVEKILIVSIIIVMILAFFLVNQKFSNTKIAKNEKSIELNNFIEYDINRSSLMSTLLANQAYQIESIWFLADPIVSTDEIEYLKSKRALAKSGIIEFIDNVRVLQRDGKRYKSDKSFYNIRSKKIITPGKFVISNLNHIMQGISMEYDTVTETTKAKNVKGLFIIKKGK